MSNYMKDLPEMSPWKGLGIVFCVFAGIALAIWLAGHLAIPILTIAGFDTLRRRFTERLPQ